MPGGPAVTAAWGVRHPDDPDAVADHPSEQSALTAAGRCGQVMRRVGDGRWWPAYPPRRAPDVVIDAARRLADGIPGRPALAAVIDEEIGDPDLSDDVDVVLAYLLSTQPRTEGLMTETTRLSWRTSSFCRDNTCVAVAHTPNGDVHVTSTRDSTRRQLVFDAAEWREFLAGAKAGEFDA